MYYCGQYPEKIQETAVMNQMNLELTMKKGNYQYQQKINFEVEKNKLRQFNNEVKNARYETIALGADGKLKLETANPMLPIPARDFGNFDFIEINEVVGLEKGERGIFKLILNVEGNTVFTFILGNKAGKGNYLLDKLSSIGVRFYIDKKARLQKLLIDFWSIMMNRCKGESYVPEQHGWIKDRNGIFHYIEEGELLWEEVKEMAK